MVKVAHPMGIYTHNKKGQPFVTNFRHLHSTSPPTFQHKYITILGTLELQDLHLMLPKLKKKL